MWNLSSYVEGIRRKSWNTDVHIHGSFLKIIFGFRGTQSTIFISSPILYYVCEKVKTKPPPLFKSAFVSQRLGLYPAFPLSIQYEHKRSLLIGSMNGKAQLIVLSRRLQRSVALCQSQLVVPRYIITTLSHFYTYH